MGEDVHSFLDCLYQVCSPPVAKKLRNCCFNLVRMARSNLSLLPGRYTFETESHVPTKKKSILTVACMYVI